LTERIINRWLANDQFRRLRFTAGEDQNPEYRIAEDARVATDTPLTLAVGLLTAVLNAGVFISVLWNVGGDLSIGIQGDVLTIPKYLVIAVSTYSILLSVAVTMVGRRLIRVIAAKNAAEAEFRSTGSHLRQRANSAGPTLEEAEQNRSLSQALNAAVEGWRQLCFQLMRTTLVSQGNVLMAPVIAWLLCAPKFLAGTMTLGDAAQATAAFIAVQTALNWLVENYPGLADCLSSVNRVASLLIALDLLEEEGGSRDSKV
jgi:putative ATP-binding cassette transporter